MGAVIFFAVMLLLAWLLVIRPQQRRVRAHSAVVAALAVGDDVMTTSGILGTITAIDREVLSVEVASGVELRVVKGAIAGRTPPEAEIAADDVGADSAAARVTEE